MRHLPSLLLLACLATVACAWNRPPTMPHWDAGVRGGVPNVPVRTHLSAAEIEAAGSVAIQNAIDALSAPGAILLPPGTFQLQAPLRLRSGVVLRGAGAGETHLVFDLPLRPEQTGIALARGSITIEGQRETAPIALHGEAAKGSSTLYPASTAGLSAGDLVMVFSENDPDLMYTDPRWNKIWARQSIAQIVNIVTVADSTITIDTPLRLDFRKDLHPRIQKITPIENAGVEALSIKREDPQPDSVIGIEAAMNCWVRDCESAWTGRGHIWINFSRFITVEGNEVHHAYNYGGGGNGYGIVAGNVATDCLIQNNVLHDLRHSMMTKRGSNGNVFAYNFSTARHREPAGKPLLCDISVHGHYSYANLFEGNVVEFIELADYWGPTGPGTTLFRNRVSTHIEINDHSNGTFVLGNWTGNGGVQTDGTSDDLMIEGNVGAAGPEGASASSFPASLYFPGKPAFWTNLRWPMAITSEGAPPFNPAQERWLTTK